MRIAVHGWFGRSPRPSAAVSAALLVVFAHAHAQSNLQAALEPYRQAMSALISAERAVELVGQPADPNFGEKFNAIDRAAYDNVVAPAIKAALSSNDEQLIAQTMQMTMGFLRRAASTGQESEYPSLGQVVDPLLKRSAGLAVTRVRDQCVTRHNWRAAILLLKYARQMELLGDPAASSDIQAQISKCLSFELRLDSTIRMLFVAGQTGFGGTAPTPQGFAGAMVKEVTVTGTHDSPAGHGFPNQVQILWPRSAVGFKMSSGRPNQR